MGERLVMAESSLGPSHLDPGPLPSCTVSPWVSKGGKAAMESRGGTDDVASNILLADVTSLMLLSAAADKFAKSECSESDSGLQSATNSAIDMIMKSLVTSNESALENDAETTLENIDTSMELFNSSVSDKLAIGQGPVEHRRRSSDSLTNTSQLSDYLSCEIESSSDLEVFRSCELDIPDISVDNFRIFRKGRRTMHDSGVASPSSYIPHSPPSPTRRCNSFKDKVHMMKTLIDDKLKSTMVHDGKTYHKLDGSSSHIDGVENPHVSHLEEIRQRHEEENSGIEEPLQQMMLERALASSVLITENNKLSQEVGALKREMEQLKLRQMQQSQVPTQRCNSEVQTSPNPACLILSDDDETDFSLSFGGFCSSDSINLLPTRIQPRPRDLSVGDSPGRSVLINVTPSSSTRRKLEVPSPLRAANYLSIASDEDDCMSNELLKTSFSSNFLCCDQIWGRTI